VVVSGYIGGFSLMILVAEICNRDCHLNPLGKNYRPKQSPFLFLKFKPKALLNFATPTFGTPFKELPKRGFKKGKKTFGSF
jgi:hypothetical protein